MQYYASGTLVMKMKSLSHFETILLVLLVGAATPAFGQQQYLLDHPWPTAGQAVPLELSNPLAAKQLAQQQAAQAMAIQEQMKLQQQMAMQQQMNAAQQQQQQDQAMQQLMQMFNGGGAGSRSQMPGAGGTNFGNENGLWDSEDAARGLPHQNQTLGSGTMDACGTVPSTAKLAYEQAVKFRKLCAHAQKGDQQKIAVNDYSGGGTPHMYIFDLEGKCLGKAAVAYGNGLGAVVPTACNDVNSHLTPSGFFLTAEHNGGLYKSWNSMALVGLQGQDPTNERGVLIHGPKFPGGPTSQGTASTWGCSELSESAYKEARKSLGYGSLVYNYFGNTPAKRGCRNTNGLKFDEQAARSCRPDRSGVPAVSTSQGAPTLR